MSEWEIKHPDAWVSASFDRIVDTLRVAGPGQRNLALRSAGYRWGRIRHIANGSAEKFDAELASAALNAGLGKKEVEGTLARAIRDGRRDKTEHRIADDARDTGPRIRIRRSAIDPQDEAPTVELREPRKNTEDDARAIWARAQDFLGTPAEAYLERRGLRAADIAAEVRYAKSADYHYAIFGVTDHDGNIAAVQRVSINADGEPYVFEDGRKRKLTIGPAGDGAFVALDNGGDMVVCEGPEDALSIAAAALRTGRPLTVKAALTTPRRIMAAGSIVFADSDGSLDDVEAACRDAGALLCAPQKPHKDANDVWRAEGAAGVMACLDAAERPDKLPIETLSEMVARIDAMPPKHVVWGCLRSREVAMVFGRSNAGKTNLLHDLFCASVEQDGHLFMEPVTLPDNRPVLWLSGEQDAEDWRSRLGSWRNDRVRYAELRRRINVFNPPQWLESVFEEHALVVLDTALTALVYDDGRVTESVGSALLWNAVHENIKPLVQRHNSLLTISHHAPKNSDTGQTPYGDMAENSMDQILQISRASGREVKEGGPYEGATGVADWYKVRGSAFPEKTYFGVARESHAAQPGYEGRLRLWRVERKAKDG